MITLTLYTKTDCPLCDTLKADLLTIQSEVGFILLERDIDKNPDKVAGPLGDESGAYDQAKIERYRNLLPVLDIENGAILYSPFSYDDLFDAIDSVIQRTSCDESRL